jgi:SAM-dependent methyltransferase
LRLEKFTCSDKVLSRQSGAVDICDRHHFALLICAPPTFRSSVVCIVAETSSFEPRNLTSTALPREASVCPGCGREYPIVRGIPRFVASDQYVENFGWQWDRFRRTQIDQFNGTSESEARFRRETEWQPKDLPGELMLDAGCGAGRFSAIAASWGARVVAVDLAGAAVEACLRNMHALGLQVLVIQASLFDLPFKPGTFDRIFSLGVLQHTPDPPRLIRELPTLLKPGGALAYWIYERRWYQFLHLKYALRPLTRRLSPRVNFGLATALVSGLFPVTALMSKVPLVRETLRFMPVAARHLWGRLSLRQQWEWAVLDTLDWYGPGYDFPQEEPKVLELLRASGLEDVRRAPAPGLAVVGKMPAAASRPAVC